MGLTKAGLYSGVVVMSCGRNSGILLYSVGAEYLPKCVLIFCRPDIRLFSVSLICAQLFKTNDVVS